MHTKVIHGKEVNDIIRDGVNLIGDTVGATMGSKGRYVLINQGVRDSHATKDGVSVSVSIRPKDNKVASVVKAIQQAAVKSLKVAGDGTTNSTILTQELVNLGLELIEGGANPIDVKRGMEAAKEIVLEKLTDISVSVDYGDEMLRNVATVSANNDSSVGDLVFDATNKVTKDGVIRVEDSLTTETYIEVSDAFEIESGFVSGALITNQKAESDYDNALILMTDDTISNFRDVEPAIRMSAEKQLPLVIVAEGFTGDVPNTIIANVVQKKIHVNLVKAPGIGNGLKDFLGDLATITGGRVISKSMGKSLKDITPGDLGSAKRVISNINRTIVEGAAGDKKAIKKRIKLLKEEASETNDEARVSTLNRRAGKLLGKVAVIKVGGGTDIERTEIMDRVDDSLRATSSALDEGVVAGGGVALLNMYSTVRGLTDFDKGKEILFKSLKAPISRMIDNAGLDKKLIIGNILKDGSKEFGYNLETDEYSDMFESGIVDPKKVIRVAVESAVSVAGILITTSNIIIDED